MFSQLFSFVFDFFIWWFLDAFFYGLSRGLLASGSMPVDWGLFLYPAYTYLGFDFAEFGNLVFAFVDVEVF